MGCVEWIADLAAVQEPICCLRIDNSLWKVDITTSSQLYGQAGHAERRKAVHGLMAGLWSSVSDRAIHRSVADTNFDAESQRGSGEGS